MKVLSLLKINSGGVVLWWHHILEEQLCFLRVTSAAHSWTPESNLPRNLDIKCVSMLLRFALLMLYNWTMRVLGMRPSDTEDEPFFIWLESLGFCFVRFFFNLGVDFYWCVQEMKPESLWRKRFLSYLDKEKKQHNLEQELDDFWDKRSFIHQKKREKYMQFLMLYLFQVVFLSLFHTCVC